jgi:Fic family protein
MQIKIGHYQQQPSGYRAFIPLPFPPVNPILFSRKVELKHAQAMHSIGKLDGITQLLPDKDFFLLMFVRKEATSSSQIEGTQATIIDAIEAEIIPRSLHMGDVGDIIYYIHALNYGLKRFESIPVSHRLICELHRELMKGARFTQHPYPGEVRRTQNWIQGTSPSNARFVPPPPHDVPQALSDLEKFIHSTKDGYPSLIKAALIHAQFETTHPFTDGNGRTGRLLITMFLWQEKLLEIPVLYLSDFFRKHQSLYYERLQGCHSDPSDIESWVDFFLEGVIETADSAINIARKINQIREEDMAKVHKLGKLAAESAVEVLRLLYSQPIVDVAKIQEWTKFTRAGAQKVIDRLINLEILTQRDPHKSYGRTYAYNSYIDLFQNRE